MGARTFVRRAAVIAAVLSLLAVLAPTSGAGAQPDASAVAVGYVQQTRQRWG